MSQESNQKTMINDDEIRPEYDFSEGLRGIHAYRFSKLASDEALVHGYWQGKGFTVGSYSKNEMRDLKTPDFRLSRNGVDVALCEVKSFQKDAWLESQMKNAATGEVVGGLRNDPIFNRISNAIHTAMKQFQSVNSNHSLFNFLFVVNHDTSARYEDLLRVLTGYEDPLHGVYDLTCAQFSEGRIREEKKEIDLYIWTNSTKSGDLRPPSYYFGNWESRTSVCNLLGIDPARVKNIPPAA